MQFPRFFVWRRFSRAFRNRAALAPGPEDAAPSANAQAAANLTAPPKSYIMQSESRAAGDRASPAHPRPRPQHHQPAMAPRNLPMTCQTPAKHLPRSCRPPADTCQAPARNLPGRLPATCQPPATNLPKPAGNLPRIGAPRGGASPRPLGCGPAPHMVSGPRLAARGLAQLPGPITMAGRIQATRLVLEAGFGPSEAGMAMTFRRF